MEPDIAWLAGLYEGEGSLIFKFDKRNGTEAWEITLHSTDEDVIRKAHAIAGVGHVTLVDKKRERPEWADQWRWRVSRRDDIRSVLERIEPYLCSRRRAKAQEFFNWYLAYTHASRVRA